jgi:hypothetical protein
METTILKELNKEVQDFRTKQIQVVPGLTFNQYDMIRQIFFYYNSKFTTGDIDDEGDRKYFLNIVKNPCKVFSKAIDFDTKNIRLLTAGGGDPIKTWFMERDLKYWMRDQQFGKVLNRIFKELPIFGSVVLKIIDGEPHFVDLRNFVVDPTAECLGEANYIIEKHNLTVGQFRKVAKEMDWDQTKVDKTIELFHQMKDTSHIRLFERYGEVAIPDGQNTKYEYRRVFIADVGIDELDNYGRVTAEHPGVELSSDKFSPEQVEKLYWEFHAEKMAGRWLGIGVVESLIEPQVRSNELANLQAKTSYWAALRVFQTRDGGINRNMMSDVRNGEIINVDSEITQIDMSDRNLAFFNQEDQKWMRNRDELTFSYDVVQGERLPAGTPLGSAQLAVNQTLSYFEGIQESVALDVKEMLYEVIMPKFQKDNTLEHTLRLVGQDLDQYIQMIKNEYVFKEVVRIAVEQGKILSNEEAEAIGLGVEAAIKQGKEKLITIPTQFYKDLKYDLDIDITGESIDTRVRSATLFAILQAITSDPTMIEDPIKRRFLYTMGEDGGVNMNDYLDVIPKKPEDMVPVEKQKGGGGVSAPMMAGTSIGQQTQTI